MTFQEFRKYNPIFYRKKHASDINLKLQNIAKLKREAIQDIRKIDNGVLNTQDPPNDDKVILIVKVNHSCNLNCPYCYDRLFRRSERMTIETVERIINIFKPIENIGWTWHGGEPLLMGPEFYNKANILLKEYKPNIDISMQSNGTLMSEEYFDVFDKTGQSYPGISFDGINNQLTRGSTVEVLRLFREYKKRGQQRGAIIVLTNDNISNIIDEYEYAKLLKYSPKMNLVFDPGYDTNGQLMSSDIVLKHLISFFDYWIQDVHGVQSSLLEDYIKRVLGSQSTTCSYHFCIGKWFGIDPNGDIFPCGRNWINFKPYENIWNINSPEEILTSERFMEWKEQCQCAINCKRCINCDWKNICNGECFGTSYIDNKNFTSPEKTTCEITKGMLNHIYEKLNEIDIYTNYDKYNPYFIFTLIKSGFISPKLVNEVHGGLYNG